MKRRKRKAKKLDKVLGELSEAICIVVTVYHALERLDATRDVGSEHHTLKIGIKALTSAHESLDLAIMRLEK